AFNDERLARIRVQEDDAQLTTVARIDQAWRVHDRDAVSRGQSGSRLDETGVALRDRDRETRSHSRTRARGKFEALACGEVETCIPLVRALGDDRVLPKTPDCQLDQRARVARSERASATRYRANRRTSRCGSRARTSTPASWSSRASIGAPSA